MLKIKSKSEMKTMLILRTIGDDQEQWECTMLRGLAERYSISVYDAEVSDESDLEALLAQSKGISYLFVSAKASFQGFANEKESLRMSWIRFGSLLFAHRCLTAEGIVLLPNSGGNLYQIAFDLFYSCPEVGNVMGPPAKTGIHELAVIFEMLLFGLEFRKTDPVISARRTSDATDIRIMCFDRLRTQTDYGFLEHIQNYDTLEIMELNRNGQKPVKGIP